MPSTATITAFYSFTARTQIKSAEINANFNNFRGHLVAIDPNTATAATTNTYDLGATDRYWRALYATQVNCSTVSASSIATTTLTATTVVGTNSNISAMVGTSINVTTVIANTVSATSVVATTATVSGIIDLTGGQIKFPATAVPSSDANTLDDYQEEDWTPRIDGSGTTGTASYTAQVGKSVKIGKRVFLDGYVSWSGGSGNGNLRIANLPYASANVTNYRASGSIGYWDNIAVTAGSFPTIVITDNTQYIQLYQTPSGGGTAVAVAYDAAGLLMFSISYNIS